MNTQASSVANTLTHTLRHARKALRVSQLELSMRVGVSQRHLSFVESGRARPSRELLLAWLEALDLPLVTRNAAMLQAGFAPVYRATPLHDPALGQASDALARLLDAHDPMPAMMMDAAWNVLRMNRGSRWLAETLVPWAAEMAADAPINMIDLLAHPDGFTRHILNLHEAGPALLAHMRDDATAQPAITPKVDAFAVLLSDRLGTNALHGHASTWAIATPVLTTRFATPHGELAFFSMFTTFGKPQDITLASLRVEHMFAADGRTAEVLRERVA